jgi:hypothetical protein
MVSLSDVLPNSDSDFSDHDLAVLSDWASDKAKSVANPEWKRAYALLREGSDLLLRRRARARCELREEQPPIEAEKETTAARLLEQNGLVGQGIVKRPEAGASVGVVNSALEKQRALGTPRQQKPGHTVRATATRESARR